MDTHQNHFLQIDDEVCKHKFREIERDGYFILISDGCFMEEALCKVDPPFERFRLLIESWPDLNGKPSFVLGPVVSSWRQAVSIGKIFVFPPDIHEGSLAQAAFALKELCEDSNVPDNFEQNETLWSVLNLLQPDFFFDQFTQFTFVTRHRSAFNLFKESSYFRLATQRKREFIRREKLSFLQAVGRECGPERCVEENCTRLRISLALRCIQHQYDWGNPPR